MGYVFMLQFTICGIFFIVIGTVIRLEFSLVKTVFSECVLVKCGFNQIFKNISMLHSLVIHLKAIYLRNIRLNILNTI
jgi:hypothetical protein